MLPSSLRRSVLLSALTFLLTTLPLFAASEPWDGAPFAGEPKAMIAAAEAAPADDAAVVVLLDEAKYTFDAQGHSLSTRRLVYRIVSESAIESWSTIEAPWGPWYQDRPTVEARVIARDGGVHQLDAKALSEAPAPDELEIFSDNRIIRAPLPGIAVGSVVEQLITYHSKESTLDLGTTDRFYVGKWVPVRHARLVLEAPPSLSLRLVNRTEPELKPLVEQKDGIQRTTFEATNLPAIESYEWSLPSDVSPAPYVGFSTGKSWQDIARHFSEIVDKQIGPINSLQSIVAESIGSAKTREEKIARLLARVERDVRYAGVEIGESSIVPRSPQEVLGHKYGDCKDKATLLAAMLRQAGIPASIVLIRAGADLDVSPDLPGLGQFNHAIVHVDGDKPLWIDPTDEFARAGELPLQDQGRQVLIANGTTTGLTLTPVSESTGNRTVETRVFTLSEEGKAKVAETTENSGASDATLRRYYAQSDRRKYREALDQYAQQTYLGKSIEKFEAGDPHDLTKPFKLMVEVSEAGRGVTDNGEAVVAMMPAEVLQDLPYSLKNYVDPDAPDQQSDAARRAAARRKRTHDFIFVQPHVHELQYRIVPPPGYVVRTLPPNETTRLGTATLTREFSTAADGSLQAVIRFDSGKRRITPAEYEQMRKAVHDVAEEKAVIVGFDQIGQLKLNEGDVGAALKEFRKLAALHTTEARHHVEIARALLVGGMGDAARQEIKRAIDIEPSYARGQATLGLILEHDLLGRPFRTGFDLDGAIAALKKARELDSKNIDYRAQLAKAYEYNADGLLFGKGARLDDAISEYKSIADDLKDDRLEGELMLALAHARRFPELREMAKAAKDQDRRDLGRLIAAAAIDGSQAAIREAGGLDQTKRRELLQNAATVVMSLRMYAQAADLMEQASQGTPKATEMRGQIDQLRKAKKYEELTLPESDPSSVVRRLIIDATLGHDGPKDLGKYLTADEQRFLVPIKDDDDDDESSLSRVSLKRMASEQELPLEFYADFGISTMQVLQEGDDEHGFRIRLRDRTGSDEHPDTYFVVKENGVYRISAMTKMPAFIGWSILRLARAGKLDIARQWLNWTREDIQAGGGDDPLAGPAFAKLWSKGKQTATLEEIEVAAASLMVRKQMLSEAMPILIAAEKTATSDQAKNAIALALALDYSLQDKWTEQRDVALRLTNAVPESAVAFELYTVALTQLGQREELEKIANARLARLPNDRDAIRALARGAGYAGDYTTSDRYYRKLVDELQPALGDFNNDAWNALFTGKELERALEEARKASSDGSSSAMHTLAALYAETGKGAEARDMLLKSMDHAGREQPAAHDWYVLGRIAETYGATDAALAAYKRVDKPTKDVYESTYVLAQRRMKSLTAK
jgi:transglutaminase-like putative cysteine protease/tetratricopeptide (TPR) repeat protein